MMSFEEALVKIVAPQLQPLGYEYAARLCSADELFGFCKPLGADGQAVIQFQQRYCAPESFTVNLLRVKAGGYDGGARLSTVLWYVMGLREYPVSDYWWPATEAALQDALEKVVQYGTQWIEDARAARPWEMPVHNGPEFVEAVEVNLAQTLQRWGYRFERAQLAGEVPYPYFVKELPDGTHGFVEVQRVYSLDPREFQFDVRLQRRADGNPLAVAARPGVSLTQLGGQSRGAVATVAEAKMLLWRYANRAELDKQLREALTQIEQIGLPWIDQAIV